jgi:catechol 2,3-dioxygenase-like lactoylglutathione lyase family enzyme
VTSVVAVDTMLCVRELARSVAFYGDVLGFEVRWRWDHIAALELAGHRVYLFLESPPTEDKPAVRLEPQAEPARGNVVLVLRVDDCEVSHQQLRERGARFLTAPSTPPWGGRRCFLHDPDGYLVELEEPPR